MPPALPPDVSIIELITGLLLGGSGTLAYRHLRPNGLTGAIEELRRSIDKAEQRAEQRHEAQLDILMRMREDQLRTERRRDGAPTPTEPAA